MKKLNNKMRTTAILLTMLMVIGISIPIMTVVAQLPVNLGIAADFEVFANLSISIVGGPTTINGQVGLFTNGETSFTGQENLVNTVVKHMADNDAILAHGALLSAYNDAAGRTPITIASELGGKTLYPGTYDSGSSFKITGTLTLDAQGDPDAIFVFQALDSTLITLSNSSVNLINNAQSDKIFWQVGSSATLGTNSNFAGNILASSSITAANGAIVQGRLLALTGSVTLDRVTFINPTIPTATPTATPIASSSPTATPIASSLPTATAIASSSPTATPTSTTAILHVIKHVINDNGRTAVAADFNLYVKISGIDVALSPAKGVESPGTTYTLDPGTYIVSEDANFSYTARYSGDCDDSGKITLAAGDEKFVTITNNDIPYSSGGGGHTTTVYPPLINIIKTPEPLALTHGQGLVTYTYKVTNPGKVALSNVSVTDDKVSPVNYVSGDINDDNLLQSSETWTYISKTNLTQTTTNTATAKGSANGMTATDIAYATVVVTTLEVVTPTIYPPLINIIKIPEPLALTHGQGLVTYTYKVTNPGKVALSNVSVTDDKVSPVNYVSGDINYDNLLQSSETWIYISKTNLTETTTNTATAKGTANDMIATDIAYATVVVTTPVVEDSPSGEPVVDNPNVPTENEVTNTVTGGQIPKTSTPMYLFLIIGVILMLIGAIYLISRKRYE